MKVGHAAHLVRRFVGSLVASEPRWDDERWARSALLPGELALWRQMPVADRVHAIGVARRVVEALGPDHASRAVVAAALLHDVGKIDSGLGTLARVGATVWRGVPLDRVRRYRAHPEIGGRLLAEAGSEPVTIRWTEDHHKPPSRWRVPPDLGAALKAADDD